MTTKKELPLFNIKVPKGIVSNKDYTPLEKLVLSIDHTLKEEKKGYNTYFNVDIANMLNVHHPQISRIRKKLLEKGFYERDGRKYTLTDYLYRFEGKDDRELLIIPEIYNRKMGAGAKLLWGEINSYAKNNKDYFASRKYGAEKLGCTEATITNWTNELKEEGLLEGYRLESGYGSKQRIVKTKTFDSKPENKEVKKKGPKEKPKKKVEEPSLPPKEKVKDNIIVRMLLPYRVNYNSENNIRKLISDIESGINFENLDREEVYPVLIKHFKKQEGEYVSMLIDELKGRMNE